MDTTNGFEDDKEERDCPMCGIIFLVITGSISWCEQCGTLRIIGVDGEPKLMVPAEWRE